MGMCITAMVMAALGAVCMATANGWRQGEFTRSAWISGSGAASQVQRALRDAKYVGYIVPGNLSASPTVPASIVYWRADDLNGVADDKPQVGELGLIEFDPATRSLLRYEMMPLSASTPASVVTAASATMTRSEFVDNPSAADEFKAFLASGGGVGIVTPIARNVSAAEFRGIRADALTPAGQKVPRPVIQFQLRIERTGDATIPGGTAGASVERGSVTLRAPMMQPD